MRKVGRRVYEEGRVCHESRIFLCRHDRTLPLSIVMRAVYCGDGSPSTHKDDEQLFKARVPLTIVCEQIHRRLKERVCWARAH